ncbi:hypothetical protein J3F84DRAFT_34712 [Trichoderma pleuroticola]
MYLYGQMKQNTTQKTEKMPAFAQTAIIWPRFPFCYYKFLFFFLVSSKTAVKSLIIDIHGTQICHPPTSSLRGNLRDSAVSLVFYLASFLSPFHPAFSSSYTSIKTKQNKIMDKSELLRKRGGQSTAYVNSCSCSRGWGNDVGGTREEIR